MTDTCGLHDLGEIEPGLIVPATEEGLERGLQLALSNPVELAAWGEQWRTLVRQRFLWRDLGWQFKTQFDALAKLRGS